MPVIVVQAYAKFAECVQVLDSIARQPLSKKYTVLVYVDGLARSHQRDRRVLDEREKLLGYLRKRAGAETNGFKLVLHECDSNKGPYLCCHDAVEMGFTLDDFVIFTEDDIVFCRDSLELYESFRDGEIEYGGTVVGVTAQSQRYGMTGSSTANEQSKTQTAKAAETRARRLEQHIWAPNKQFGLFKTGWDRISFIRNGDFSAHPGFMDKSYSRFGADRATGHYCQENRLSFLFSFVPRIQDIGFYHVNGVTTRCQGTRGKTSNTIKSITTDDLPAALFSTERFTIN
jgi:hypothetical protein